MPSRSALVGGDAEEARIRAALLLAQMDRFFELWVVDGVEFDRARAIGTLTDQWLLVLGGLPRALSLRQ